MAFEAQQHDNGMFHDASHSILRGSLLPLSFLSLCHGSFQSSSLYGKPVFFPLRSFLMCGGQAGVGFFIIIVVLLVPQHSLLLYIHAKERRRYGWRITTSQEVDGTNVVFECRMMTMKRDPVWVCSLMRGGRGYFCKTAQACFEEAR